MFTLKTLIYDHHPVTAEGLTSILSAHGCEAIHTTSDAKEFVRNALILSPDIIIMDPTGLSDLDIENLSMLKQSGLKTRIYLFAENDSSWHYSKSYDLLLAGFISKSFTLQQLELILDQIKQHLPLSDFRATATSFRGKTDYELILSLTQRELQVFKELATGKSNMLIAKKLMLSNKTISSHKRSIMKKMNTQKEYEVIDLARRNGF